MRVLVEGFHDKFVEGEFVSEDNEYVKLFTTGGQVRIPKARIVLMYDDAPPAMPEQSKIIKQGKTEYGPYVVNAESNKGGSLLAEKLKQAVDAGARSIETSRESQGDVEVEVTMQGEDYNKKVQVLVPARLMTGRYSSSLGKNIFSNEEVVDALAGHSLKGVPSISGNKIIYSVSKVEKVDENAGGNIGVELATKAMGLASGRKEKKFSLDNVTPRSPDFSMSHSPFVGAPKLSLGAKDEDS